MKLSQFIAEIKTSMKSYDAANLIDEISINNWVIDELKRFGSNLMSLEEEIITVKNGKAKLPDNYWHPRVIARVYAERFENLDGEDEDVRFSRELYDRIERGAKWLPTGECLEVSEKTITEKVYVDQQRVELHYSRPILLNVTRGVTQRNLDYECINLSKRMNASREFEVVINNRTLQANFTEGVIYLQYYGLERDEDNEIIIPETQHNRLKVYLEYFVKSKILEDAILNNDDRSTVNLWQVFEQKAANHFDLAMTEAKMEGLNWRETRKLMKNQNKRKMKAYEGLFPTI
jgi:hypothetical protein